MNLDQIRNIQAKYFSARPFSLDDTGVTHRELTYWDEKGLLPSKVQEQKWRRFNLVELAWIRFIANLRKLNVGLPTIARIKYEMFADITKILPKDQLLHQVDRTMKEMNLSFDTRLLDQPDVKAAIANFHLSFFESFLYGVLLESEHVSIAIAINNNTGIREAATSENNLFMEPIYWNRLFASEITPGTIDTLLGTCICISINEIIGDVFQAVSLNKLSRLFSLSEQEKKILETIREGNYKEVTIRFSNTGVPDRIETTEEVNLNKSIKLFDILTRGAFEDLYIKTKSGHVLYTERKKITRI